ncbi:hypothetical protein B0H11DRAFT_2031177 [Mycena galericulata]|nr:hypothetical protein B0H11DRAFT_2031177 [Mycena galericulata]
MEDSDSWEDLEEVDRFLRLQSTPRYTLALPKALQGAENASMSASANDTFAQVTRRPRLHPSRAHLLPVPASPIPASGSAERSYMTLAELERTRDEIRREQASSRPSVPFDRAATLAQRVDGWWQLTNNQRAHVVEQLCRYGTGEWYDYEVEEVVRFIVTRLDVEHSLVEMAGEPFQLRVGLGESAHWFLEHFEETFTYAAEVVEEEGQDDADTPRVGPSTTLETPAVERKARETRNGALAARALQQVAQHGQPNQPLAAELSIAGRAVRLYRGVPRTPFSNVGVPEVAGQREMGDGRDEARGSRAGRENTPVAMSERRREKQESGGGFSLDVPF